MYPGGGGVGDASTPSRVRSREVVGGGGGVGDAAPPGRW
jgi:hypothetical protein